MTKDDHKRAGIIASYVRRGEDGKSAKCAFSGRVVYDTREAAAECVIELATRRLIDNKLQPRECDGVKGDVHWHLQSRGKRKPKKQTPKAGTP